MTGGCTQDGAASTTAPVHDAAMGRELTVEPLTADRLVDVADLFGCDAILNGCWCMWHVIRVVDFHAAGTAGNRASFEELMRSSEDPLGVVAYDGPLAVGWCAAGPRSRYERAVKTPTMKGRDPAEDDAVWLVPCFFVRGSHRRQGVTTALLDAAVELARAQGATAIEGFPDAATVKSRSLRGAYGGEEQFAAAGFTAVRRPSSARALMRLDLA